MLCTAVRRAGISVPSSVFVRITGPSSPIADGTGAIGTASSIRCRPFSISSPPCSTLSYTPKTVGHPGYRASQLLTTAFRRVTAAFQKVIGQLRIPEWSGLPMGKVISEHRTGELMQRDRFVVAC
jgi:hypothetical protein